MNRLDPHEIEDVRSIKDDIQESYILLYEKYGIKPNVILLSRDVILKLNQANELAMRVDNKTYSTYVMGMLVAEVRGTSVIKAAIILED